MLVQPELTAQPSLRKSDAQLTEANDQLGVLDAFCSFLQDCLCIFYDVELTTCSSSESLVVNLLTTNQDGLNGFGE